MSEPFDPETVEQLDMVLPGSTAKATVSLKRLSWGPELFVNGVLTAFVDVYPFIEGYGTAKVFFYDPEWEEPIIVVEFGPDGKPYVTLNPDVVRAESPPPGTRGYWENSTLISMPSSPYADDREPSTEDSTP